MDVEAKIEKLGLPIKVVGQEVNVKIIICRSYVEYDGNPIFFNNREAAYNWIAKEFKLDNLVSKDEVITWFYEHSDGIEEARIFDINDFNKWLEDK